MRDSAFDQRRDVHRLCVIGDRDDEETLAIRERLLAWSEAEGKDLNIELHFLATDDPATDWTSYDLPSAPQKTPVVALIGYHVFERRPFFFGSYWEPAPTDEDLAILKSSPIREAIGMATARSFAVLVHIPRAGDRGEKTHAMLAHVSEAWSRETELPVPIVTVDRNDPREKVLAGFLAVVPTGPEWVGVVFGRGKVMMPPLVGGEISEAGLQAHYEILMADCTCSRSARSMGVDMPLAWTDEMESAFVPMLDEDAEDASPLGAATQPTATSDLPDVPELPLMTSLLVVLGGLTLVVLVVVVMMVLRRSITVR